MRTLLIVVMLAGTVSLGQPCEPEWSDKFPLSDLDGGVSAAVMWDDPGVPGGPALYAVGHFERARNLVLNGAARWDGQEWAAVGNGPGAQQLWAVMPYDDDGDGPHAAKLYAVGDDDIYTWDGVTWTSVHQAYLDYAMAVFDEDGPGPKHAALFVGSLRFDGVNWTNFTNQNNINSIVPYDPDGPGPQAPALYFGGRFTQIGLNNVPAKRIARWTGSQWEQVGGGIEGEDGASVYSLHVADLDGAGGQDAALYTGGYFETAGGVTTPGVARWDGGSWSAFGAALAPYSADEIAAFDEDGTGPQDPTLYVAVYGSVRRWDGAQWVIIGKVSNRFNQIRTPAFLSAMDVDGAGPNPDVLVCTGSFETIDKIGLHHIIKWDGTGWSQFEPGYSPDSDVGAMTAFDEDGAGPGVPALFVGGEMFRVAGQEARGIARWDGDEWSTVGGASSGMTGSPRS